MADYGSVWVAGFYHFVKAKILAGLGGSAPSPLGYQVSKQVAQADSAANRVLIAPPSSGEQIIITSLSIKAGSGTSNTMNLLFYKGTAVSPTETEYLFPSTAAKGWFSSASGGLVLPHSQYGVVRVPVGKGVMADLVDGAYNVLLTYLIIG